MNEILFAVLIVAGIGLVCAVVLAVASKVMEVKVDPRIEQIRNCLPGANCGACGFTGCDGYAQALVEEEGIKTNLCIPGADAAAQGIANVLGVEFEDVVEKVAFVRCNGDCMATHEKHHYEGISSCAAANMLYSGQGACAYGCLGYGDCVAVCPQGAICIENGIAHVDTRKCVGCGLCADACPNHLIYIFPDVERVVMTCSNKDKGPVARKACTNGCIGCKRCEKVCEHDAIHVVNNLAQIDYDKCVKCEKCAESCPVGCIKISDFSGIHRFIKA